MHLLSAMVAVICGSLVGWLFWTSWPFEIVFKSIPGRPTEREREREKRNNGREKNYPNNPHPHLLQAQ